MKKVVFFLSHRLNNNENVLVRSQHHSTVCASLTPRVFFSTKRSAHGTRRLTYFYFIIIAHRLKAPPSKSS